ncbi:unnamed protein product [Microthlaspi erraticum]|uniref:Uncharacterized protein n=1 Tax=Microthlaspi erraticum TaxID=1685480 RepID=A0A6D2JQC6_9BRAS|nr:unnamed protein product [Microthlaspi erraticum]
MGRSTLWDWKTKTWDLIQRSQRRLGSRHDQERTSRSEDTTRLSRWDDHCTNMGRVNRTTKYQSSPNQEEKSLDDIRTILRSLVEAECKSDEQIERWDERPRSIPQRLQEA